VEHTRTHARWVGVALALSLCASSALAGDVHIAERPLIGPFTSLQSAVDAALEGESLLVTPGEYRPFTIDGKSVRVLVTSGGEAAISGGVTVKNIAAPQHVVLSRLNVTGGFSGPQLLPALEIANIDGHVRVQDSVFVGCSTSGNHAITGAGARVESSHNVVFSACTIEAGRSLFSTASAPTDGGNGVDAITSSIALYDCTIRGGSGSSGSLPSCGKGGAAYLALGNGLFAHGTSFEGGDGGRDFSGCAPGGAGGDALVLDLAQAHLLDDVFLPGAGGSSHCGAFGTDGTSIVTLNGAVIDSILGTRRRILAPTITSDDTSVRITIFGQPGDTVFLMVARRPSFLFKKPLHGAWMLPMPSFSNGLAAGTIGANGELTLQRTFDIADGSEVARMTWLQALCVDTSGYPTLTGPAHVLSLE